MKFRNGFVSNSSSSSFVLIVDKEAHDKAMEQLKDHKYIEILKEIIGCLGKDKFMGRDVVTISGYDSHGDRAIGNYSMDEFNPRDWADAEMLDKIGIGPKDIDDYRWDIQAEVVDGVFEAYRQAIPADCQMYQYIDS